MRQDDGANHFELKPYPEYKESGIPYLDKVPKHWQVEKLKYLSDLRLSNVDKKSAEGEKQVRLCNYVDVYYRRRIDQSLEFMEATASENQITRFELKKEDVLITKDSETPTDIAVSSVAVEDLPGVLCGYHLALLRPDKAKIHGSYLAYALSANGLNDQFCARANGITRFSISTDDIGAPLIPKPTMEEQRSIAVFLDRVTAHLDALIEKKRRLLELLAEKRQALITHAMTKGLDPKVRFKDSGVEWLGEVPEHWSLSRIGNHIWTNPSKSELNHVSFDSEASFVPMDSVGEDGALNLEDKIAVADGSKGFTYFRDGDILLAKITPCFENGKGAICQKLRNGIGFGSTEFYVLRPDSTMDKSFLFYFTHLSLFRERGTADMRGSAGQQRVPEDFIRTFKIALPPMQEQKNIAAFLDHALEYMDALVAKKLHSIKLLKEKRQALIAEAVTGKVDLRHWKPA